MARRPNYQMDRRERERAKAAKRAEREAAKQEKAQARKSGDEDAPADTGQGDHPGGTPGADTV